MTSQKQILANKENSKKSTGPKNIEKVKKNAVKFGIFSRELIINLPQCRENKKELVNLVLDFNKEYFPQTPTEKLLVDKIIECCWRLKRIRIAERSMIEKSLLKVDGEAIESFKHWTSLKFLLRANHKDLSILRYADEEYLGLMIKHANEDLIKIENDDQEFIRDFLQTEFPKEELDNMSDKETRESAYEKMSNMRTMFEAFLEIREENLKKEINSERNRRLVPHLDNLLSYETTIERQLYRAIIALRRLKGFD